MTLNFDVLVKGLMEKGATRENAERLANRKLGREPQSRVRLVVGNITIERGDVVERDIRSYVSIGSPPIAVRQNDSLQLVLLFPPRSKKNHTENYGTQSLGYRKFKNAVVRHIRSLATDLGLPLPDQPYNCAATFYTDNDAADTQGLIQGLSDALENAGVISNDRYLRTWNGTDQVLAADHPRVELTITPIIPLS